jgi:hypothetical protein
MKIIVTNDGLIGLDIDKQSDVIWCHNQDEALAIMWSVFGPRQQFTKEEVAKDLAYGIDHCRKTGDDVIEFGCLGSFMYTTKSEENNAGF